MKLHAVSAFVLAWGITIALGTICCQMASAQEGEGETEEAELLPEIGEPRLQLGDFRGVRRGQVAPSDGILMAPETILRIQVDYDALAYRVARVRERAEDRCTVRLDMERARTRAESERVTLRDSLWSSREQELLETVRRVREEAVRQWYENPGLWTGVGALVASLVAIILSET